MDLQNKMKELKDSLICQDQYREEALSQLDRIKVTFDFYSAYQTVDFCLIKNIRKITAKVVFKSNVGFFFS